jgi:hypothetical protein
MKRLFFGVVLGATVLIVALLPGSTAADIGVAQATQVVLSCTDGHSVSLSADPATLSSLTADVQAINAGGTGNSCALDTSAAAPTAGGNWTVYDYNASGQEIAPRNSPNSQPAMTSGGTTTFDFLLDHYTALLTTNDKALTGDLSATTLTDTIQLSGSAATFETQHNGGDCVSNFPAAVRFFFVSPAASGKGRPGDPGFYTQFWWSARPIDMQMLAGIQSDTITAQMSNPAEWSDWNGQSGANPAVTPAFLIAISHVQEIGLSFGGECFFETGVKADNPPETVSSSFSEG